MDKNKFNIISLIRIFLIIGIIGVMLFVLYFLNSKNLLTKYVQVNATISQISHDLNEDGEVNNHFCVDFTFKDVEYKDVILKDFLSWEVGDELKIFVDLNNPNNVKGKSMIYFEVFIVNLIILVVSLISITFIFKRKKKRVA